MSEPSGTDPVLAHARLEGERVVLRPVERADAEPAFALVRGRREILDWLIWPGPDTVREIADHYSEWASCDGQACDYQLAIVGRDDGLFAGTIGARFRGHPGRGELGYWLATERWGRGWTTEAVGLVAHLAFHHLRSRLLYARVFTGNDASRRVLENNGWSTDHTARVELRGEPREQWHLSLTNRAWRARGSLPAPLVEDVRLAPPGAAAGELG